MNSKIYTLFLFFLGTFSSAIGQDIPTKVIQDSDLDSAGVYTWTKDTIYHLDGFVFLENTGSLTIEAGTIIKGLKQENVTSGDNASALIISRGATIYAVGTKDAPIIFTGEDDDLTDPFDLTPFDRGEWGGLIILGAGTLGNSSPEAAIEGIPAGEYRAVYGGTNDADSSGVLKFVSIRHGGAALSPGDEINGLTLGGVGSGTEISYVEVYSNLDDGIEFFGGAVDFTLILFVS